MARNETILYLAMNITQEIPVDENGNLQIIEEYEEQSMCVNQPEVKGPHGYEHPNFAYL